MTSAVALLLTILTCLLLLCLVYICVLIYSRLTQPKADQIHDHTYLIIYASQSGHAENYAKHTAEQLQQAGEHCVCINIQDLTADQLKQAQQTLWFVSTYGEGDAPDSAQRFQHQLSQQTLDLSHQTFAILAFGDRRYRNFCAFGQRVQTWLNQQQAQPAFNLVCVDQLVNADLTAWHTQLSQFTQTELKHTATEKVWIDIHLKSRSLLNAGSQGTGLYFLSFQVAQQVEWHAGDIIEIQCANSNQALKSFVNEQSHLNATHLEALRFKNLKNAPNYVLQTTEQSTKQSIESWINHLIDLPIREYSIANIPTHGTLDLIVRQEIGNQGLGLGSGLLTQDLQVDETLRASIRHNPSFHLKMQDTPCIFIGNGSGLAGLMAHLQQRQVWGYQQNWLIFGERQQQYDAICNAELSTLEDAGYLPQLDRVYSRDGQAQSYVQDVIIAKSTQLKNWVEQGATLYICGSLHGMAQGVEQALIEVLGVEGLAQLKQQQRYKRDVY
ncbi:hypothetical protein D9K79_01425 [Acinetobacter cumulans]|uniref:NADPH--hemoprotein reductase n=1 Tax=Acinetobacter cumulans TaxID=2136182 RepID=A0ABX9UB43_9GAMM|nr:NADPH cytochrome P450 oxidoreductase family protein [Acinetobacter cumulans]RLL49881.1 hypothetical protein D9K79_01425 [Acinetobacter cumulans]